MVGEFLVLNKYARVKNNEKNGHVFYHGTFEGKVQVFVRRIQKLSSDSTEKEVGRDHVTHLLTDVHKNIIRYYDDTSFTTNDFCTVFIFIFVSLIPVNFLIISIEFRSHRH
jgi:hypothetical protein